MSPSIDLPKAQSLYHSYLVRMWCSNPEGLWRASAQHTLTGRTVTFANLESLFRFLHEQSVEGHLVD